MRDRSADRQSILFVGRAFLVKHTLVKSGFCSTSPISLPSVTGKTCLCKSNSHLVYCFEVGDFFGSAGWVDVVFFIRSLMAGSGCV